MNRTYLLLLVLWALGTGQAWACTGFVISDDTGAVIAAKNEDWDIPCTKMWFVQPEGDDMGYVLFGYDDEDTPAQGGMNQAGLVFDSFYVKDVARCKDHSQLQEDICEEILATCDTVEKALECIGKHGQAFLDDSQWLITDDTGAAALIDHKDIHRKDIQAPHMVATNFRLSEQDDEGEECSRYQIATDMLEKDSTASVENARRILFATHIEINYPTQYSVIYEPKEAKFHLYYFHNFQEELVFDLKNNLQDYEEEVSIPDGFTPNFAACYYTCY